MMCTYIRTSEVYLLVKTGQKVGDDFGDEDEKDKGEEIF